MTDPLRRSYLEMMRAHVDDGGQLSHRNGMDLLAEVERLRFSAPDATTTPAPAMEGSLPRGESDPAVMQDCAGAGAGGEKPATLIDTIKSWTSVSTIKQRFGEMTDLEVLAAQAVANMILIEAEKAVPSLAEAADDWKDDPSADERWQAGCDFAMLQLCAVVGIDPKSVTWDAANETLDGDVSAVICNILRARLGDDFDFHATTAPAQAAGTGNTERELADLIVRFYWQEIGCLMQQAEHWAKENHPLAVHHRVRKADAYYQIIALFDRRSASGNPFDTMRRSLERGLVKPAGTYPPTPEIHAYRDPAFVVEKLKTASKAAGGPA